MKYISTRGHAAQAGFSDVLLAGLAPDGGLYVPEQLPRIDRDTLERWRLLSYPELGFEILSLFADDIPSEDLKRICLQTWNAQNFGSDEIVPIKTLPSLSLHLVGLSEGPTLAFKDMAMQFLGNIFEYVLGRRGEQLNILGATSGDTGSAAQYALKGKQHVNVFMLSPDQRMSAFQRAQMYSLNEDNIFNIAIQGVFDDCQDIVKDISADADFKRNHRIGAVNSINFARIAAQIVYYFWAWARTAENVDAPVSFAVPSGNFGNILAGHYARMMGLPISRLVLATNENNVLEEFFNTGRYVPRHSQDTFATSSPSMDISKASNLERFIFDLLQRDSAKLAMLWPSLAEVGHLDFSDLQALFTSKYGFCAGVSTHENRLAVIRECFEIDGLIIDPHTADGVHVAKQFLQKGIPMLVLETALPAKFNDTIVEAIGRPAPVPSHLEALLDAPQHVDVLPADAQEVKAYISKHLSPQQERT